VKLGQRLRAQNEPEDSTPVAAPAAAAQAAPAAPVWTPPSMPGHQAPVAPAATAAPAGPPTLQGHGNNPGRVDEHGSFDPLLQMKEKIHEQLITRLGVKLFDQNQSDAQLRATVVDLITQLIQAESMPLTSEERNGLISDLSDNVLGHGPIDRFLKDPAVSEIMVQGTTPIFVERAGKLTRTKDRFYSNDQLRRVIERIVSNVGRRIDESSPMVDARLADGSRVNAVIPPLAVDGPALTIRKFSRDPLQVQDLINKGSLTAESAQLLAACVAGALNIIVSGGTGTGKTTMLNILSSFIPPDERIVTIEDAVELQLRQPHVVRLETRPPNIEGKGAVTIRDLVKNSLRMRPDRVVIGECRGGEALDMLQAMNTGHDGSLTTLHANTPRDALSRLETLVLMAGYDLPTVAIRQQIASAVDMIVQIARFRDGSRRVVAITEVEGMEGQTITLSDIFAFDYGAGVDANGRHQGTIKPTGIRPKFSEKLLDHGISLPAGMFGAVDLSTFGRK
jgi:pilus assembly protein CpaF